jgi:polygalacturonase
MVEQRSKGSKATQRIGGERRRGKKVPIAGMSGAVGRLALSAALLVVGANLARAEEVCATVKGAGDGVTLDTVTIQKAIDACAGKGVVRLAGTARFVSAPLLLKSHTVLEIAAGTTLEGSPNHADYPEMEVFREKGLQPLLLAKDAEDITIRGGGTIDGKGESWWPNEGPRPRLIIFDHVKHVVMENVTVQNSPMWQIVPYYSEDLIFRNMKVLAPTKSKGNMLGRNTDGIDPFSSKHILIDHVLIDTGDDNVAIKSGQPGSPGPDAPSEDIHIVDCTFLHGHGLSVGSEIAGGVKHLRVERVSFNGTTQGIRIKSGRDRGNDIGDFIYKDITMQDVGIAIQITEYYGSPKGVNGSNATAAPITRLTPHFHDISIENVSVKGAKVAMEIDGLPEVPIKNVRFKNVTIEAERGATIRNAEVNSDGLIVQAKDGDAVTTGVGATGILK